MFKSRTQKNFNFASLDSCAMFLEGLRALRTYEQETARLSPSRDELQRSLNQAENNLGDCVRLYPDDRLPHFYYGIVLTIQNQEVYANKVRAMQGALESRGKVVAALDRLHLDYPGVNPDADPLPGLKNAEDEWLFLAYREAREEAAPFEHLVDVKWPLLEAARDQFSFVRDNGPGELRNTAIYNLAQVHSRLGTPQSLENGNNELNEIGTPKSDSTDDRALSIQVDILRRSLRARYLVQTGGSDQQFQEAWRSLEEIPGDIQKSKLTAAYKRDLKADCLVKSGYVLYDQALYGHLTNSRTASLDQAADRFQQALDVRNSWNQAQLYLAVARAIQAGAADIRQSMYAILPSNPTYDGPGPEELSRESKDLFEALLGKIEPPIPPAPPAENDAEQFVRLFRKLFANAQEQGDAESATGSADSAQAQQDQATADQGGEE